MHNLPFSKVYRSLGARIKFEYTCSGSGFLLLMTLFILVHLVCYLPMLGMLSMKKAIQKWRTQLQNLHQAHNLPILDNHKTILITQSGLTQFARSVPTPLRIHIWMNAFGSMRCRTPAQDCGLTIPNLHHGQKNKKQIT